MKLVYIVERETGLRLDGVRCSISAHCRQWRWNVTAPIVDGSPASGSCQCIGAGLATSRARARAEIRRVLAVYDSMPKKLSLRERARRTCNAHRMPQAKGETK